MSVASTATDSVRWGTLRDVLAVAVLLLSVTFGFALLWMLRRVWPSSAPVKLAPFGKVLAAGWVIVVALTAAASFSMLPFQLDGAGRQACSLTLGTPGPGQREEAVALAGVSEVNGLREAAGPGTSPSQRYYSVERWCSSND